MLKALSEHHGCYVQETASVKTVVLMQRRIHVFEKMSEAFVRNISAPLWQLPKDSSTIYHSGRQRFRCIEKHIIFMMLQWQVRLLCMSGSFCLFSRANTTDLFFTTFKAIFVWLDFCMRLFPLCVAVSIHFRVLTPNVIC